MYYEMNIVCYEDGNSYCSIATAETNFSSSNFLQNNWTENKTMQLTMELCHLWNILHMRTENSHALASRQCSQNSLHCTNFNFELETTRNTRYISVTEIRKTPTKQIWNG